MAEAAKEIKENAANEQAEAQAKSDSKNNMRQNLTGKQKAAMFLISIGPEKSAEILRHLKDEEVEYIISTYCDILKGYLCD